VWCGLKFRPILDSVKLLLGGGQINWDLEAISQYLQSRELTDEQIRETRITFLVPLGKRHCRMNGMLQRQLLNKVIADEPIKCGLYTSQKNMIEQVGLPNDDIMNNIIMLHELEHLIESRTVSHEDSAKERRAYFEQKAVEAGLDRGHIFWQTTLKSKWLLGTCACLAAALTMHGFHLDDYSMPRLVISLSEIALAGMWSIDSGKKIFKYLKQMGSHQTYLEEPCEQRARAAADKYSSTIQLVSIKAP